MSTFIKISADKQNENFLLRLPENSEQDFGGQVKFKFLVPRLAFYLMAGILIIMICFVSAVKPLILYVALGGAIFAVLFLKNREAGIKLALFFTLPGELARIPVGPENGLLINDIFIPIIAAIWLVRKIIMERTFPKSRLILPFSLFMAVAVVSLINGWQLLEGSGQIIASSSYLGRFLMYFFLFLIAKDEIKTSEQAEKYIFFILKIGGGLALLGFLQLILVNDFTFMAKAAGWDPHIGRLFSTWFDPNYFGGFLVLVLSLTFGLLLYAKKNRFFLGVLAIIFLVALWLTYSRSAYLTFAFAVFVLGLLRSRKLLIVCLVAGMLFYAVSPRMQQRVTDMYFSGLSLVGLRTVENPDATARLRVESWQNSLSLVKQYFWTGTGYNTLRYIKLDEGLIRDTKLHSAAGFDSSLLTILTTTGIFGLLMFIWLYWRILKIALLAAFNKKLPAVIQGAGLGAFAGIVSLFLVHSLFVNSLLYYPILVYVWAITGVLEARK